MRRSNRSRSARFAVDIPFITLIVLLVAAFLLGGGSRGDIVSLVVLRPLAVLCLAIGLLTLRREHVTGHGFVLALFAACFTLIGLHLVPLPETIWSSLPGRDIAVTAGALVGLEGQWRPLTLTPHRGWNGFYAMFVPAAALVLAIQLDAARHRQVFYVVLGLAMLSAVIAVAQVAGDALYFYRITNTGYPVGLFSNRNHHAALLCCALVMVAAIAVRANGPSRGVVHSLAAIAALVFILLILASGSRGGLIGGVLALLASAVYLRAYRAPPKRRGERSLKPIYAVGALGVLGIAIFLAIAFSRADAVERIAGTDPVSENRFLVWGAIWQFLWTYQPFGSGAGSFVDVFQIYEPREMLAYGYWNQAHNDWLQWVLEFGLIAIVLLGLAIYKLVARAGEIWTRLPLGRGIHQMAFAGIAVIFILGLWSLVDYPLRVPSLVCLLVVGAVWTGLPTAEKARSNAGEAE